MAKMPADIRSLCRAYTPETVRIVAGIVRAEQTKDSDRLTGIAMLWERGWGRPPQAHTGENGEGDIRVTIRHIVQEISAQKVIDVQEISAQKVIDHD